MCAWPHIKTIHCLYEGDGGRVVGELYCWQGGRSYYSNGLCHCVALCWKGYVLLSLLLLLLIISLFPLFTLSVRKEVDNVLCCFPSLASSHLNHGKLLIYFIIYILKSSRHRDSWLRPSCPSDTQAVWLTQIPGMTNKCISKGKN